MRKSHDYVLVVVQSVLLVVFDHELTGVWVVVWHVCGYVGSNCVSFASRYFVFHRFVRWAQGTDILWLVALMEVTSGHRNASDSGYASKLNVRGAMALHSLLVLETLLTPRACHHHVTHLLLVSISLHHINFRNVVLIDSSRFLTMIVLLSWLLVLVALGRLHVPKWLFAPITVENLTLQVVSRMVTLDYRWIVDFRKLKSRLWLISDHPLRHVLPS